MSLLDVLGSRAQRSAAEARLLYARLQRGLVEFSATKIVLVPTSEANGSSAPASTSVPPPAAPDAPAAYHHRLRSFPF